MSMKKPGAIPPSVCFSPEGSRPDDPDDDAAGDGPDPIRPVPSIVKAAQLVSGNAVMLQAIERARRISPSLASVVLQGESGRGKEVMARFIHVQSARQGRFVAVNCGAIPETLVESELFGHKKGSFTGAIRSAPGQILLAHRGTLFLDEIGDLTPSAQVKLLRALETRMVQPVGAEESAEVDFRLVCATNKDLERETQAGRFREDLYYRIATDVIWLPPLRERKEDIPMLAESLLRRYLEKNGRPTDIRIDPSFFESLMAYNWPGNVRELRNVMERTAALVEPEAIAIEGPPPYFDPRPSLQGVDVATLRMALYRAMDEGLSLAEVMSLWLRIALERHGHDPETFLRLMRLAPERPRRGPKA